jgi:serine protease Do
MVRPLWRHALNSAIFACAAILSLPTDAAVKVSSVRVNDSTASDAAYQALVDAAQAVVSVKVKAIPNARSNETLGAERTGSGMLIRSDGLVLTIGYLILEADTVEVTDALGTTVPASVVSYDHATGFGLVKAIGKLAPKPIRLGDSGPISQLDRLMIVTSGEEQTISIATVVSKRQFAGYWEYLIDDAIFTAPPRLDHSGAALINQKGELVGVGSLFVMDALVPGERLPGNMFVPVNLLKPVLDDLVKTGRQNGSRRPWLGVNSLEEDGRVKVMQVNEESPADKAGIVAGDIILRVNGEAVESLENFYGHLWDHGAQPGTPVRLTVLHGPEMKEVTVQSIDRADFMRHKPGV